PTAADAGAVPPTAADAGAAPSPAAPADGGAAAGPAGAAPEPPAPPDPGAPSLAITVDKNELQVGDVAVVTVKVRHRPETRVWLSGPKLDPFELIARDEVRVPERQKGQSFGPRAVRQRTFVLRVTTYDPKASRIPGITVAYLGKGGETRSITGPDIPV